MPILTATNLTIACPTLTAGIKSDKNSNGITLLEGASFTIEPGITALLGPSGCGKSTLLRALAGLHPIAAGTISIDHHDITLLPPAKRNIGLVFQDFALFPNMTVLQNVLFGVAKRKFHVRHTAHQRQTAEDLLAMVGLADKATAYPDMLSGGQKQRTALARALAAKPQFLLLDEPFSSLDPKTRTSVRTHTISLLQEHNIPTLLVTHDEQEALAMADAVFRLDNKQLHQVTAAPARTDNLVPFSRVVANQHRVAAALV